MASTPDGPRYVAGIQDEKDKCCYKDFFEAEILQEVKEKADEKSDEVNRSAIVWDRKLFEIVYKKVVHTEEESEKPLQPRRGKRNKIEKKIEEKSDNDEYF